MFCLSSACGRRYLNSRYNSVRELEMVVPDRNVAPRSRPVRSCMVLRAKSMLSARWLPSGLPRPATRSCRVLNIRFLNLWLSSTQRWSIPIRRKSTASSLRWSRAYCAFCSLASRLCWRLRQPVSIRFDTFLPCALSSMRFCSTLSSSARKISCWISGDCGIIPNCSCERITASQSLFLICRNICSRFFGVKSSRPG